MSDRVQSLRQEEKRQGATRCVPAAPQAARQGGPAQALFPPRPPETPRPSAHRRLPGLAMPLERGKRRTTLLSARGSGGSKGEDGSATEEREGAYSNVRFAARVAAAFMAGPPSSSSPSRWGGISAGRRARVRMTSSTSIGGGRRCRRCSTVSHAGGARTCWKGKWEEAVTGVSAARTRQDRHWQRPCRGKPLSRPLTGRFAGAPAREDDDGRFDGGAAAGRDDDDVRRAAFASALRSCGAISCVAAPSCRSTGTMSGCMGMDALCWSRSSSCVLSVRCRLLTCDSLVCTGPRGKQVEAREGQSGAPSLFDYAYLEVLWRIEREHRQDHHHPSEEHRPLQGQTGRGQSGHGSRGGGGVVAVGKGRGRAGAGAGQGQGQLATVGGARTSRAIDTREPMTAVMSVMDDVSAPTASIRVLKYCLPASRSALACRARLLGRQVRQDASGARRGRKKHIKNFASLLAKDAHVHKGMLSRDEVERRVLVPGLRVARAERVEQHQRLHAFEREHAHTVVDRPAQLEHAFDQAGDCVPCRLRQSVEDARGRVGWGGVGDMSFMARRHLPGRPGAR